MSPARSSKRRLANPLAIGDSLYEYVLAGDCSVQVSAGTGVGLGVGLGGGTGVGAGGATAGNRIALPPEAVVSLTATVPALNCPLSGSSKATVVAARVSSRVAKL